MRRRPLLWIAGMVLAVVAGMLARRVLSVEHEPAPAPANEGHDE